MTSRHADAETAPTAWPLRPWSRLAVLMLWGTFAALTAGCRQTECTGDLYCPNFTPDKCVNIPGCAAVPVCLNVADPVPGMSSCPTHKSAASCPSPACAWVAGGCVDSCTTLTDSTSCYAAPLVHDAHGILLFGCSWYLCSGTVKNVSCNDSSADSCPLGRCSIRTNCGLFPDC